MRLKEWMIGAAIAALTAAVVFGSFRGTAETKIEGQEKRITTLEDWRPTIDSKLGSIDAKIDMLLRANDIEPPKK